MRLRTLLLVSCAVCALSACATSMHPNDLPLYGDYENIDNQSLCMGMIAFSADYPQAVWPGNNKGFYSSKKDELAMKSAALFKIAVKKYGKQDAGERGITGYSSAKSLAFVLGGGAVREALNRCEPTVEQALEVDGSYQDFLNHLGKVEEPAVVEIVPSKVPASNMQVATPDETVITVDTTLNKSATESVTETAFAVSKVRRYTPDQVPAGMKIFSTPAGDYLIKDTTFFDDSDMTPDTSSNSLNEHWKKENLN